MRPSLRALILSVFLLAGVASLTAWLIGIIHDVAAVAPGAQRPALAASVAARAGVLWGALLGGAAAVASGIILHGRAPRHRSLGNARFARPAELRPLTGRCSKGWFPLGYLPRARFLRPLWPNTNGGPVSRSLPGPRVHLSEEDLARHVLVVGLTGARKTTAVIFPVLLEAARRGVSAVALDLKYGEEDSLSRLAPEWARCGRDVLVFAPLDPASLHWNPLAGCRTSGEAHHLAALLFEEAGPSDPALQYWMGVERHVCASLALALATDEGPPTMERMHALCQGGPDALQAFLRAHPRAGDLTTRLGAFLAMLPKDKAGILQGIASRLEAWNDEVVRGTTGVAESWEQIDLGRLRREPILLILGIPQSALLRLRWLCHMFLRDLASCLLRPRGPGDRVQVLQILEELPAWGPLPNLADHLATFRSRQVSVIATVQSEVQGEHVYGRDGWAAVSANLVTKIYFPSLADLDAECLSRAMGTTIGEDLVLSQVWDGRGSRTEERRHGVPIPLRRPEELQGIAMSADEIVVRFARIPPARLWCPPYYARSEYAGRVPARPPTTVELAVYHHLWHRRMRGERERGSATGSTLCVPASCIPAQASSPASNTEGSANQAKMERCAPTTEGVSPTEEDVSRLSWFVGVLLQRPPGGSPFISGMRRGDQLLEVRVDPNVVVQICGGLDAMHAMACRWSVLRWVLRVRPVFILGRRALRVLTPDLVRQLADTLPRQHSITGGNSGRRTKIP